MAKPEKPQPVPANSKPEPKQQQPVKPVYEFTPAERESVANVIQQIDQLNGNLQFFLNHIVREHSLPPIEGGYTLNRTRTGLVTREQAQQE